MILINISADVRQASSMLGNLAAKQMPYAIMLAVNRLAFEVQRGEAQNMSHVFRSPRPFTLRSSLVHQADRSHPVAEVYIRPEVAKYLSPYEYGGLHVLPGPALLAPKQINVDAYGQLPKNTIKRLAGRQDIYVGPVKTASGQVINGVWQRLSVGRGGGARRKRLPGGAVYSQQHGALKLLIRFGRALPVRQHLDFNIVARRIVGQQFRAMFASAINQAIKTAR